MSERGALMQKGRSAEHWFKKGSERGVLMQKRSERRKIVERGVAMSKRVGARSDFYPWTGPFWQYYLHVFQLSIRSAPFHFENYYLSTSPVRFEIYSLKLYSLRNLKWMNMYHHKDMYRSDVFYDLFCCKSVKIRQRPRTSHSTVNESFHRYK